MLIFSLRIMTKISFNVFCKMSISVSMWSKYGPEEHEKEQSFGLCCGEYKRPMSSGLLMIVWCDLLIYQRDPFAS